MKRFLIASGVALSSVAVLFAGASPAYAAHDHIALFDTWKECKTFERAYDAIPWWSVHCMGYGPNWPDDVAGKFGLFHD